MLSIAAETFAAAGVRPLPSDTSMLRLLGRMAWNTGNPIQSSPVRSAKRVMPMRRRSGTMRASVVSAGTQRQNGPGRAAAWTGDVSSLHIVPNAASATAPGVQKQGVALAVERAHTAEAFVVATLDLAREL